MTDRLAMLIAGLEDQLDVNLSQTTDLVAIGTGAFPAPVGNRVVLVGEGGTWSEKGWLGEDAIWPIGTSDPITPATITLPETGTWTDIATAIVPSGSGLGTAFDVRLAATYTPNASGAFAIDLTVDGIEVWSGMGASVSGVPRDRTDIAYGVVPGDASEHTVVLRVSTSAGPTAIDLASASVTITYNQRFPGGHTHVAADILDRPVLANIPVATGTIGELLTALQAAGLMVADA